MSLLAASGGADSGSSYDQPDSISCPICMEVIKEAFMTSCGHSFCYLCISRHLDNKNSCPLCNISITRSSIFPNFVLNDVITKNKCTSTLSTMKQLQQSISESGTLSVSEINGLVSQLLERKKQLQDDEKESQLEVLSYFLEQAKTNKLESVRNLNADIEMLTRDIQCVDAQRQRIVTSREPNFNLSEEVPCPSLKRDISSQVVSEESTPRTSESDVLSSKKRRIVPHLSDLECSYFNTTQRPSLIHNSPLMESAQGDDLPDNLSAFSDRLSKISKFSKFKVHANMHYDTCSSGSNIVSSIEFDRDEEFFAAAGVTKKIKIFEYDSIMRHPDASHFPLHELTCRAKLSCLSWNSYVKCQLAASDYEGVVWLWDVFSGSVVSQRDEHDRRIWSVDFSKADPTRLASGSDDGRVKIWATNQEHSVITLLAKANVCCVQFHPRDANQIMFGCADHQIQWFDLRNIRTPLFVLKGHKKAVSYVKFLGGDEIVSASTDSTLKLWSISDQQCVRTFHGHKNEKNFVGLSTNGDFIACGSETNTLHTFLKVLSTPIVSHDFSPSPRQQQNTPSATPITEDANNSHFVSSVCWRQKSNVAVVGNSQGMISVMELV
eukprot:c12151_g1_i1.p1 GENE.c12151_g1_i1~~c12151_g1_i1.p1  ORF type:complete len:607 (+),score=162.88 c12151_g1_i1:273-2093(+)